jgi:prepilin-type N-terminal cleavage/methylation domain-containing protein
MTPFKGISDERGMTLVELLVAMSAGVVLMTGVTLAMIVTMRETSRVASHVESNQRARLTMTKIINQLHSACVAPQIAPVREDSTGTMLSFLHQSGSAVAITPVLSRITLSGTTLTQSDYAATGGAAPEWTFATTPSSTTQLMTGVSALSESVPLFRYFAYSGGKVSSTPLSASPLGANAATTVQVSVAFKASPEDTVAGDTNAQTGIQNAALLRLTPPGYSSTTANLPCQ